MKMIPAQLILATGDIFDGLAPASQADTLVSEVVFNTGMTGYVETLTDPSYAGQMLTFTYPLIGNYGVGDVTQWESSKIQVSGVIVSELAPNYSHHAAEQSLAAWLIAEKIPFITDVDTRALTKALRTKGVVNGIITTHPVQAEQPPLTLAEHHWVKDVSIKQPIEYGSGDKLIIAVDCGMKENILRNLLELPVRIKRVPFDYDFTQENYDGLFISNGPGDPATCIETIALLKKAFANPKPTFGICLGAQLMALAIGAKTYKLPFGHRGQNQPCLQLATERCFLTSQNHGYAIDETTLPPDWRVNFRHLNDQTVAGIEHKTLPLFSVQFHPEAAPGPMDTTYLFQQFYEFMLNTSSSSTMRTFKNHAY